MKRVFVSILAVAAMLLSANAQEPVRNLLIGPGGNNWFLEIGGGANFTYDESKFSTEFMPAVEANIGKWFTPAIGFRMGYHGIKALAANDSKTWISGDKAFGFHMAHLDAMWNMAGTSTYKINRVWNPILYIRGGWIFPTVDKVVGRQAVAGGIGLDNQFRLGNHVSLSLDVSTVVTAEKQFRTTGGSRYVSFPTATAGLVFDLGGRGFNAPAKGLDPALLAAAQEKLAAAEKRAQQADATIVGLNRQLAKYNDLVNGKIYEYLNGNFKETEPVESQMIVPEILYFDLAKSTLSDRELARLEDYAQNTFKKDQKLLVTGCADLGTGSREVNDRLSRQRAEYVKDILVNQFGYKAENIETKADVMPGDAPIKGRIVTIEVK